MKRESKPRARARTDALRLRNPVRLSAEGLAKVLGDLEARVMRVMWDLGTPSPARQVHERVVEEHDVAILTVITVLNKLVAKGYLRRAKRGDLLHFEPRWNEAEFMALASRQVVEGMLAFEPDAIAAALVDVLAENDPERLAELGRLVRRRLREQGSE